DALRDPPTGSRFNREDLHDHAVETDRVLADRTRKNNEEICDPFRVKHGGELLPGNGIVRIHAAVPRFPADPRDTRQITAANEVVQELVALDEVPWAARVLDVDLNGTAFVVGLPGLDACERDTVRGIDVVA